MNKGDLLEVAFSSKQPEVIGVDDGILVCELTDKSTGQLLVVGDTRQKRQWTGKYVNLGTITTGGLLPNGGFLWDNIVPEGYVVADFSERHFGGRVEDVRTLPSQYTRIKINGRTLFDRNK